ncbi:hypothetical protein [Dasania marina]|uniref:dTMP kinase n=1 Tax=Dasania marina TaxID=471499 RepID=UPI0030DC5E28|tara:strand:- start:30564 stop:31856 length:1293 start_codon:yes stop_codon:yes gene_type:complete
MMNKDVEAIGAQLANSSIEYAILNRPDAIKIRDIDVLVRPGALKKAAVAIEAYYTSLGFGLRDVVQNSYSIQLFFFIRDEVEGYKELQIDLMPEISFRGVEYLSIKDVLLDHVMRRDSIVFVDDVAYYIYQVLRSFIQGNAGDVDVGIANKYLECLKEAGIPKVFSQYEGVLSCFFKSQGVSININVRNKVLISCFKRRFLGSLCGALKNLYYKAYRGLRPTGVFVSVLGPDGAGKSTIIDGLSKVNEFKGTDTHYLLPCFMERYKKKKLENNVNVDPYGRSSQGIIFSVLKQLVWLYEYNMGYLKVVRPSLAHGKLVIFDRYYDDMIIDPIRYGYSGPVWILKAVNKFIPSPHLILSFYASAEIIQNRKSEVTYEETSEQLKAYANYNDLISNGVLIDTDASEAEVLNKVLNEIDEFLENRARARFVSL